MPATPEGFALRLQRLRADLVEQGRRVQSLLEGCFEAVFARDPARAARIIAMDDAIDTVDVEIEKQPWRFTAYPISSRYTGPLSGASQK